MSEHSTYEPKADVPPLRIHHFLSWTTLTAAIMSGCATFDRWTRNGPPIENPIVISGLVLGAATIAGALTIAGCGLFWRRCGCKFPASPGDCLLTLIAGSALVFLGFFGLFVLVFFTFGDDDWFPAYYIVSGFVLLIAWLKTNWVMAKNHADSKPWKSVFWLLMPLPFAVIPVMCLLAVAVPWAIWSDWRDRAPRNWTHWCGIAFFISLWISLFLIVPA